MSDTTAVQSFKFSKGGLFHTLFLQTHIIEEDKYHTRRVILVFIGLTWLPLLILAVIEGNLYKAATGGIISH
jgi:hypothetical protein